MKFSNRFKTKKGENLYLDWIALADQKSEIIYFSGVDNTKLKLNEMNTFQSSRIYSLGELTVGISSVMSNLISIIGGNVSFLYLHIEKESLDKEEIKKNVTSIDNATQKLSKIIRGLRFFIRTPENDPVTNVQLSQVVSNVLGLCQEKFRIYAVKLKVITNDEINLRCRATQLSQVFINLLNNSFDAVHAERDSWVSLEIVNDEDVVKISVGDSRTSNKIPHDELINMLPKELIKENSAKIYLDKSENSWKVVVEISRTENVRMEIL